MNDKTIQSTEAIASAEPTLFHWFPELRDSLPWVPLTRVPSPVHRLADLGRELGLEDLWIKRDDACGLWYGGNKPRKLEFLLGDAVARRARAVITFGGLGSNHAVATAVCGRRFGLHSILVLVDQPISNEVRHNLLLAHAQGAELVYAGGSRRAAWAAARHWLVRTVGDRGRRPYLVLPGGSSPRGCLGYVNAALELADQIKAKEMPPPDDVFVPVGSNGTMAGLQAGFRLAGLETRGVGVRVSDRLPVGARAIAMLANRSLALLHRYAPGLAPRTCSPTRGQPLGWLPWPGLRVPHKRGPECGAPDARS